jgi:hypothetical protein
MIRAGLAIDTHSVRAVAVRGRRIVWHDEVALPTIDALPAAIDDCLSRMPRGRIGIGRLSVAVSPAFAQLKRMSGLPACKSRRDASELVRRNVASLFVHTTGRSMLCGVHRARDGAIWAAVVDDRIVDHIAVASARVRFTRVLPSIVALSPGRGETEMTYLFDTVTADIRRVNHEVTELRVRSHAPEHAPRLALSPELNVIGNDGWRYACAYGATQTARQPFVLKRLRPTSTQAGTVSAWRLAIAGGAAGIGLLWFMLAPGLAGELAARGYRDELAANAAARRDALIVERALEQHATALESLMRYGEQRRIHVRLLGHLASVLPTGAALAALHVDSLEGNLVVLAERAASVVSALDRPGPILTPKVIGPITQEVQGGTTVERATISFRLAPEAREPATAGLRS